MDEINVEQLTQQLLDYMFEVGPSLILAAITLFAGLKLIKFLLKLFNRSISKSNIDDALGIFLGRFLSIGMKVLLIISVVSMLGVDTTSFIAVIGAAGLAVGFALQGSLANFAGGVLILFFKPFRVGDFIDGQGHLGTVASIDILHTVLKTPDNKTIIMPNGQLANSPITNFSKQPIRRVEYPVGISYSSDIKKARKIILRIFEEDERVLDDPAPMVVLTELADSSLNLSARAWVNKDDFWPTFWENLEQIKETFDKEGIAIPFPQRDVHLFEEKK